MKNHAFNTGKTKDAGGKGIVCTYKNDNVEKYCYRKKIDWKCRIKLIPEARSLIEAVDQAAVIAIALREELPRHLAGHKHKIRRTNQYMILILFSLIRRAMAYKI